MQFLWYEASGFFDDGTYLVSGYNGHLHHGILAQKGIQIGTTETYIVYFQQDFSRVEFGLFHFEGLYLFG
jgi:hypothetical protein